jgi:hypothetical protein
MLPTERAVRTGIRPAIIFTGVTGVVFLALFRLLLSRSRAAAGG